MKWNKSENVLKKHLMNEKLLTVREFALRVRKSARSVNRWIAERQLHHFRCGVERIDSLGRDHRVPLIPESEVERMLNLVERIP